jgi:transposase
MARFDLSDVEWRLVKPLLPNKPCGVALVDDRRVLNGILYVLRTGSPWRDLPIERGDLADRVGLSTKINAVVDENGLPVRLMLTAGQAHDLRAAPQLLAGLGCRHVVADRGYDADALLALIRAAGAKPHIPSTSHRLVHRSVDRRPPASTSSQVTFSPPSPWPRHASGCGLMSPLPSQFGPPFSR